MPFSNKLWINSELIDSTLAFAKTSSVKIGICHPCIDLAFNPSFCNSDKMVLVAALADKNKFEVILDGLKSLSKILIYDIKSNISTVTAVGYGIKNDNGICFDIIDLLSKQQIKIKEIDLTETSFTATLEDQDTEKAIKLLHKHFKI